MRKYRYLLIIIVLFRLNVVNVNASSGRLKKDSIIVCNNIMDGQHGDDNHYHIAEKKVIIIIQLGMPYIVTHVI